MLGSTHAALTDRPVSGRPVDVHHRSLSAFQLVEPIPGLAIVPVVFRYQIVCDAGQQAIGQAAAGSERSILVGCRLDRLGAGVCFVSAHLGGAIRLARWRQREGDGGLEGAHGYS